MGKRYYNDGMVNEQETLQDEQKTKLIDYWIRSAEYDLEVSESLYEKNRFHYSLFFGHLAIEKILKAIFVKKKSIHAPFSHSLTYLVEKAGIEIQQERLERLADFMDFYIEGRYPGDLDDIFRKYNPALTREKREDVKEMFEWLKKKLQIL
jgi:HEPN domain-containing protein